MGASIKARGLRTRRCLSMHHQGTMAQRKNGQANACAPSLPSCAVHPKRADPFGEGSILALNLDVDPRAVVRVVRFRERALRIHFGLQDVLAGGEACDVDPLAL